MQPFESTADDSGKFGHDAENDQTVFFFGTSREMKGLIVISVILGVFLGASCAKDSASDEYVSRPLTKKNINRVLETNKNVFVKFFTYW
jgi:hypothetical protein